jgi:2-oxoglutarate dehydrogenase E2 component (dihydrolipoamide succinyltransferase)
MKSDIPVPEIGESITSGILAAWLKEDGAAVSEGEEIFELETDKATLGVPSPAAGVLHHGAAEGDEVEVGQVVGQIDSEGSATAGAGAAESADKSDGGEKAGSSDAKTAETKSAADAPKGASGKAAATTKSGDTASGSESAVTSSGAGILSPAARRVVEEHGLDASKITGTGPGGRITKADAEKAARGGSGGGTPGSGASGRPPALGEPAMPTNERQRRVPLSNLRKRIAENLVYSRQSSAHVTTFNEVDMSAVMGVRSKYKETFNEAHGVRLGFMSFFVKAAQVALQQFPEVNAYLDGSDVLYNDYVNVGVALSSEKGLLTPVLKDVEAMSFADVERQIIDFSQRANNRRLRPDEMVGATFTISNGGVFGSLLSTPIPSPPQTAVLGMHTIQKRPVAVGDEVRIRPMMYLALTYDHRMIDGREAVLFLGRIKEQIEDPTRLLLGL